MSSYGLLSTGFVRKPLDVLLSEVNARVTTVFGSDINLDPESPDGQINGFYANSFAEMWLIAELAYSILDPTAAFGVALSQLVKLNGLLRNDATGSTVNLTLTGTTGTVIPSGSIVESDAGDQFATDAAATLVAGTASVGATCTETGPIAAAAGSITTIITNVPGWSGVNNASDATPGTDEETDEDLKVRRDDSVAAPSLSLIDSQYANLADLDGVTAVSVLENDTDAVDVNGQDPHSTQAIVQGGAVQDIVDTIWKYKAPGIPTFGSSSSTVQDVQGQTKTVYYTRPTVIDIYVKVTLTTNAEFPGDGADQIKQAIVDYAEANFGVGDDVVYTRLYTPINEVPGHSISALLIDTITPPVASADIAIAVDEISSFEVANIEVVV